MNDTIEVFRNVFEPIALLIRDGLFENEKDALKCLVLEQAASKIRQFDLKISEIFGVYRALIYFRWSSWTRPLRFRQASWLNAGSLDHFASMDSFWSL